MDDRDTLRVGRLGDDMPSGTPITPQPRPTSARIKGLLSRALMEPETLSPSEVREMAASVVYYLISERKT